MPGSDRIIPAKKARNVGRCPVERNSGRDVKKIDVRNWACCFRAGRDQRRLGAGRQRRVYQRP